MRSIHDVVSRTAKRPVTDGGRLRALAPLVPTGAFLLCDAVFGLVEAMIVASVANAVILVLRRRSGDGVGIVLPVSLSYVLLKSIAGVATDSEVVYFGAGLAVSAVFVVAIGATAFTQRPAAIVVLPLVTPYRDLTVSHPVYRRVAAQVTAAWAAAELAVTTWEWWHLTRVSGSEFVLARTLVAWPVMGAVVFCLVFYVRLRLDRLEHVLASGSGLQSLQLAGSSTVRNGKE